MNCRRVGCEATAEVVPVLKVPSQGIPIPEHDPVEIVFPIPLCRAHAASVKCPPLEGTDLGNGLIKSFQDLALVPPDFNRVFFGSLDLDSDAWRNFTQGGGNPGLGGVPGATGGAQ